MAIILFDNASRKNLYPFSNTRAIADIRMGIFTFYERWKHLTNDEVFVFTEDYLKPIYSKDFTGMHTWVDASLIPDETLFDRIISLEENTAIADSYGLIAGKNNFNASDFSNASSLHLFEKVFDIDDAKRLQYPWQIFQWNDEMMRNDFSVYTSKRKSVPLNESNRCIKQENIFIEEGVTVNHAILNASTGPIYIGRNAVIMEGTFIRGPVALCENAVVKMGAKIYGATTLGPHCTGGGEIKNTVLQSYSNKSHDGYLGDSVIGNWCNLGAGTSNSNVKNNAGEILMEYGTNVINVGNKCGCFMGDYSRTAINTSINTGTIIGTCCNVFGEGFTAKKIPSFQWGNKSITRYEFDKALKDINNWKKMKQQNLSDVEIGILKYIFEQNI